MIYIQTTLVEGFCDTCNLQNEVVEVRETGAEERIVKKICLDCLRKES